MPTLTLRDDLGRDLRFAAPPRRIVSLVPSDTYSLFALGAGDRVVGRTRYCELPAEAAALPTVGGTKDVDVDAVIALGPDLVVANQEENTRPALERLAQHGIRTLVSLPRRAADGIAHLARLARILGVEREPAVAELIRRGYHELQTRVAAAEQAAPLPTFVPIWGDPLMTLNGDTFGSDVLATCGAANVFSERLRLYPLAADLGKGAAVDAGERDVRYPRITTAEVIARRPALILLPDEPHPFTADELAGFAALDTPAGAAGRVAPVSGKDLFWYGAWTIDALPRLAAAIDALR